MDESQRITLRAALGERRDGSWAASRVGDFGPRQGTGKSDKIAAREFAGLILFEEQLIIHTAHEFPTANESFLRLVSIFENYDDLRRKVARIRYANGEQGIELLSGQRLKYKARTGGGGRGFAKADLIVYDEAQHLSREHLAASGPAKLANPNSQTWYAGSGGLESSVVAWDMRLAALSGGAGRLAYTESTAEHFDLLDGKWHFAPPNIDDLDAWYQAMPGLGRWVNEEGMRALYDELGPEKFARECLCVWDSLPTVGSSVPPVITADEWNLCRSQRLLEGPIVLAVDVAPYGASAAICASDGQRVEVADHRKGSGWVAERLAELLVTHDDVTEVVGDMKGAASALAEDFAAHEVTVRPLKFAEIQQACGSFLSAVKDRKLHHGDDNRLDVPATTATKREVAKGEAWLWSRRDSDSDITPLVAATYARWAAALDMGFVGVAWG